MERRTLLKAALALLVGLPRRRGECLTIVDPRSIPASNFHAVYGDPALRERFLPFLQNVFHLYPEDRLHRLIAELTARYPTDETVYRALVLELPHVKPALSGLTYGVPALHKQKEEMTRQALAFLDGRVQRVDGYVEIGTTGRYVSELRKHLSIAGEMFVVNDVAPTYGPTDLLERGGVAKIGTFVPLGNYDPFAGVAVPERSIDLVTNFIGFHHCPDDRLDGFVRSIHRVLRPGGRLLLRDHDVGEPTMWSLVALAHDVFNAGVGLTWDQNHRQVRRFRAIATWSDYLAAMGFRRSERLLAQDGDPTRNLMLELVKV